MSVCGRFQSESTVSRSPDTTGAIEYSQKLSGESGGHPVCLTLDWQKLIEGRLSHRIRTDISPRLYRSIARRRTLAQGCRGLASRPPKWSLDTGGAGLQTRISGETRAHRRFWRFEDDDSGTCCFEQSILSAMPLACDKGGFRQTCGSEDPRPQCQAPTVIRGWENSLIELNYLGNVSRSILADGVGDRRYRN